MQFQSPVCSFKNGAGKTSMSFFSQMTKTWHGFLEIIRRRKCYNKSGVLIIGTVLIIFIIASMSLCIMFVMFIITEHDMFFFQLKHTYTAHRWKQNLYSMHKWCYMKFEKNKNVRTYLFFSELLSYLQNYFNK